MHCNRNQYLNPHHLRLLLDLLHVIRFPSVSFLYVSACSWVLSKKSSACERNRKTSFDQWGAQHSSLLRHCTLLFIIGAMWSQVELGGCVVESIYLALVADITLEECMFRSHAIWNAACQNDSQASNSQEQKNNPYPFSWKASSSLTVNSGPSSLRKAARSISLSISQFRAIAAAKAIWTSCPGILGLKVFIAIASTMLIAGFDIKAAFQSNWLLILVKIQKKTTRILGVEQYSRTSIICIYADWCPVGDELS